MKWLKNLIESISEHMIGLMGTASFPEPELTKPTPPKTRLVTEGARPKKSVKKDVKKVEKKSDKKPVAPKTRLVKEGGKPAKKRKKVPRNNKYMMIND